MLFVGTFMFIAGTIKVAVWWVYFVGASAVMWNQWVDYIIRSNDEKSQVAPHFNYLDLRDAMVPLMTPLA